ncbi:MAG: AbrB/MazE/SpoVT family DNA-binding domain-containing protein [Coleofasciculaceae cyanobacterium SM2_3_26]|nr:AbrB/MazE/SpoVT family DNA-binding domain-containing protein [Coleofasciculaceae cyanobacterium SM2_3_26]
MQTTQLLTSDRGQIVVLPADYQLNGTEVYIKKIGNAIVLLEKDNPWQPLLDSLDRFSDDFMGDREQPLPQERENPFE